MPFAAPRYRRSPQPPLQGRARGLAFPRPSRVLHPRLPELGREECGAHRGRLSGHSAGRGIRRMAGRAPSWCPWDLGLGPPGDKIALVRDARPPDAPGVPALFRPEPGGWPGVGGRGRQRHRSGSKRPCGRPPAEIPLPVLSRSSTPCHR